MNTPVSSYKPSCSPEFVRDGGNINDKYPQDGITEPLDIISSLSPSVTTQLLTSIAEFVLLNSSKDSLLLAPDVSPLDGSYNTSFIITPTLPALPVTVILLLLSNCPPKSVSKGSHGSKSDEVP